MWQMVFVFPLSGLLAGLDGHPGLPTDHLEEKQIPFATYTLAAS
jgi:hypothetical protein